MLCWVLVLENQEKHVWWTGHRDITIILLKTALNGNQSIIFNSIFNPVYENYTLKCLNADIISLTLKRFNAFWRISNIVAKGETAQDECLPECFQLFYFHLKRWSIFLPRSFHNNNNKLMSYCKQYKNPLPDEESSFLYLHSSMCDLDIWGTCENPKMHGWDAGHTR